MTPKTWLESFFHRPGRNILRMVAGKYLVLPQSTAPPADPEFRSALFVVPGGTGTADELVFCHKNAAEAIECGTVNVTY